MRIAIIAPPWLTVPPAAYGGTELVLDNLCRGLKRQGHDVMLFSTGDSTCDVDRRWTYGNHLGVDRARPIAELRQVIAGYDAASEWGAEVIHDHTVFGPVWAQLHADVPVTTTNHGPFTEEVNEMYRRLAHRIPVIAISHHQASTAKDVPISAVIHHGIDTDSIPVGDGAGGYAAFLGRFSPDKGVPAAIEVAREAGVPLKIAAKMREAEERAYFDAEVRPLLRGRDVEYVGELGAAEKHALLAGAVCLLNPIMWPEPFGMVMIEALAAGTPVVGTPRGAAPEIVDDGVTGFLHDDRDGMVRSVQRVGRIDRSECRRQAELRFSIGRMARDHEHLYESLLTSARVRAAELDTLVRPARAENG